jgi:peptide chain release factor 3
VGPLQFEVVQYRLQSEYGAESRLESAPWQVMRWLGPETSLEILADKLPSGTKIAIDAERRPVLLFPNEWGMNYFQKQNPAVGISDVPFTSVDASTVVPG